MTATAPRPAALDAATLCEAFQLTAAARGEQVALRTPGGGVQITYGQYAEHVRRLAGGLAALGIRRNAHLSRAEQIKRHLILPVDWVAGGDELTQTMKLRRKLIEAKYADEIASLYTPLRSPGGIESTGTSET